MPSAFVSYSWDNDAHREWLRELASRLRRDGIDVSLDRWATVPGDQLPAFMESAIRENDYVLIICTPRYKERSDTRRGGVGYEGDIMTAEVMATANHRKFIPILRQDDWTQAAPGWLAGKYYVDLRGDPYSEASYMDVLTTVHGTRPTAPPLGSPFSTVKPSSKRHGEPTTPEDRPVEEIKITGVIVDEVTRPRADGTRGSALYKVPFRLSRAPDRVWAELFVRNWDRPPRFTTMHRPGIASVFGSKVVLDATTLQEVEQYHRDTLVLVIDETNRGWREIKARSDAEEERRRTEQDKHQRDVRDISNRLRFD